MKRTIYDTPLHEGSPGKVLLRDEVEPQPKPRTLKALADEYGVHPDAITTFRRRHPEIDHWSIEQTAAQVARNKDHSYVARRQQQGNRTGWRNRFGSIDYGDEDETHDDRD